MVKEHDSKKPEVEEDEEDKKEEVEKSFDDLFMQQLNTIVESQTALIETQESIGNTIVELYERVKALETPTDLKLSPKGSQGGDGVGAKVTVPETPYPQGEQAKLDADGKEIESGHKDLEIQGAIGKATPVNKSEIAFTTETPRPNAAVETVNKSLSKDFSPILKDARSVGYEGLSQVARDILAGKYYVPSDEERLF